MSIFAVVLHISQFLFFMEERKLYTEIPDVQSLETLLGLSFPESATEFQKATLCLAHLYACIRDFVLKGRDVPVRIVELANMLNTISYDERFKQR